MIAVLSRKRWATFAGPTKTSKRQSRFSPISRWPANNWRDSKSFARRPTELNSVNIQLSQESGASLRRFFCCLRRHCAKLTMSRFAGDSLLQLSHLPAGEARVFLLRTEHSKCRNAGQRTEEEEERLRAAGPVRLVRHLEFIRNCGAGFLDNRYIGPQQRSDSWPCPYRRSIKGTDAWTAGEATGPRTGKLLRPPFLTGLPCLF